MARVKWARASSKRPDLKRAQPRFPCALSWSGKGGPRVPVVFVVVGEGGGNGVEREMASWRRPDSSMRVPRLYWALARDGSRRTASEKKGKASEERPKPTRAAPRPS